MFRDPCRPFLSVGSRSFYLPRCFHHSADPSWTGMVWSPVGLWSSEFMQDYMYHEGRIVIEVLPFGSESPRCRCGRSSASRFRSRRSTRLDGPGPSGRR
jgi:hypothetical protein